MNSPAHSLRIAATAPATTLLVERQNAWPDGPQQAISVRCCPSCDLAINPSHRCSKDSWTTGYGFLCFPAPAPAFRLEAKSKIGIGRRELALLAFPHQPRWGIVCPDLVGFASPEDPVD